MRAAAVESLSLALLVVVGFSATALFGVALANSTTGTSTLPANSSELSTSLTPDTEQIALSEYAVSPAAVDLEGQATNALCTPTTWTLYWSTSGSNGPWTELGAYGGSSDTVSLDAYGLASGTTYWWYVHVVDGCLGNYNSNTFQLTQPNVATLASTLATPTSVTLSWNNLAVYGEDLTFTSYVVSQSINGGTWTTVTTLTDVSSTSYTVSALSPATTYAFEIHTNDNIGGTNSQTTSNERSVTTPGPLSATATADPTTTQTGQSVSFTCSESGGEAPYTYSWNFGDGTTGSGATTTHTYDSAGTMDVSCTVTDSFGSTATDYATVTVTQTTGGGGGGGGGSGGSGASNSPVSTTTWIVIAVVIILVVAVVVALAVRGRKPREPQASVQDTPPPSPPQ
jgi:PKD repeat protein